MAQLPPPKGMRMQVPLIGSQEQPKAQVNPLALFVEALHEMIIRLDRIIYLIEDKHLKLPDEERTVQWLKKEDQPVPPGEPQGVGS